MWIYDTAVRLHNQLENRVFHVAAMIHRVCRLRAMEYSFSHTGTDDAGNENI